MVLDIFVSTELCRQCKHETDQDFISYSVYKGTETESRKKVRRYIKRTCHECGNVTEYEGETMTRRLSLVKEKQS